MAKPCNVREFARHEVVTESVLGGGAVVEPTAKPEPRNIALPTTADRHDVIEFQHGSGLAALTAAFANPGAAPSVSEPDRVLDGGWDGGACRLPRG
jgi:hypothetical protein